MDVPCEMLLHPELLTNEQLKYILLQRHLRVPNIDSMSRDDLLDVFHQFCVPYGQRRYRDSGRGKILNKTRHMSPERMPVLNTMNNFCNNQSKRTLHSNDRIKPPPDLLSGHMKRIKLENKSAPVNNVNILKRKMSTDNVIPEVSPPKKDRKPITWP
ncbi:developmental protein domain-containing protein [Phthorimaea operculella]|nr:developmental protein domain-containing protein [Phthorimaea operculella]